jgi:uncharacterized membrane protein
LHQRRIIVFLSQHIRFTELEGETSVTATEPVDVNLSYDVNPQRRLLPIDAFRGLIIILMALDHANYFIAQRHPPGEYWGGSFPSYESVVGFLTRFVTHLSAPGFFFLMGIGMVLFSNNRLSKGWSYGAINRHFVLRGMILILLQFLVINPIWKISPIPFPVWYQGVLVALGGTMIIGILFLWIRPWLLLTLTAAVSIIMEVTHPDPSLWGSNFDVPLGLVFGFSGGNQHFWVNYPILAWLEFVTFGMVFGHWFKDSSQKAFRRALFFGYGLLIAFFAIRAFNGFGNIRPITSSSWIDFLNVVKYPPGWSFTFITMGLNLILLSAISWGQQQARGLIKKLAVFGRVPLFIYISHLLLYALLGRIFTPQGSSYVLMYAFWLGGLALLYPLALWYAHQKTAPTLRPLLQYL